MLIICLDIGGSGIKIGLFKGNKLYYIKKFNIDIKINWKKKIESFYDIENECIDFLKQNYPSNKFKLIGISTPGIIINNNYIKRWNNKYNIIKILKESNYTVYTINDGESHLLSTIYKTNIGNCLGLSLGTGLGFSLSSENGYIQRFQSHKNIELSDIPLHNSDIRDIHYHCGYSGFKDAWDNDNFLTYLINLRYIIQILCGVYQPVKIYLYGGIISNDYIEAFNIFNKHILPEIKKMTCIKKNNIEIFIGENNSGLLGCAYYVLSRINKLPVYENELLNKSILINYKTHLECTKYQLINLKSDFINYINISEYLQLFYKISTFISLVINIFILYFYNVYLYVEIFDILFLLYIFIYLFD